MKIQNLQSFVKGSKEPLTFKSLLKAFAKSSKERKMLRSLLREGIKKGIIVKLKDRRYISASSGSVQTVTGVLDFSKYGYAFLLPDDRNLKDVFIQAGHTKGAFHKDRVEVAITGESGGKNSREGIVKEILSRGLTKIIGRVQDPSKSPFMIPVEDNIELKINLKNNKTASSLNSGDLCAALVDWESLSKGTVRGEIIKNFKNLEDPKDDVEFVIMKNNLPASFPDTVLAQSESIEHNEQDISLRTDLRDIPFITVDPADAKDYDDAVYASNDETGGFTAWIAISDVSAYVKAGTKVDQEAYRRGNSYYFPGRVIPMLPPRLSNGLCSLSPETDKLALTVKITLDAELKPLKTEFMESVIRNHLRISYDHVQDFIDSGDTPGHLDSSMFSTLKTLVGLSKKLYQKRLSQGGIDFDLPEPKYIYDDRGGIIRIERSYRKESNQLVEELMLLANKAVALKIKGSKLDQIYRVHEEPDPDKLREFYERASALGYHRASRDVLSAADLNRFLSSIKDKGRARTLRYLLLRSMKQAKYSTHNQGHYGLGFENYVHFTSPIRRYPDLVTHRILKNSLFKKSDGSRPKALDIGTLDNISAHCSKTERAAGDCERDILKIKCARFMADKLGQTFTAFISGAVKGGFFVELEEHMVEGFCPLENIPRKNIPRKRYRWGKRETFKYSIGDRVKVKLVNTVIERQLVEFQIIA